MKLEQGKWYVDRSGSRWHIDYVGTIDSSGHDESGYIRIWHITGRCSTARESSVDLVAEYKESSLRPWNSLEELPLNAWFRHKDKPKYMRRVLDVGFLEHSKTWYIGFYQSRPIASTELLQDYEHSLDGKKLAAVRRRD